jgi:hypothetical protein
LSENKQAFDENPSKFTVNQNEKISFLVIKNIEMKILIFKGKMNKLFSFFSINFFINKIETEIFNINLRISEFEFEKQRF